MTEKRALPADQQALLDLMRDDNAKADAPFRPTRMWVELLDHFDAVMRDQGIGEVEIQPYNTKFSQATPSSPRYYWYALWMLYSLVRQYDRLNILERVRASASEESGLAYEIDGRPVSWDLLISVATLYAIAEVNDAIFTEHVTVADLGAGWGRIGHVLKQVNPRCTYVVFDLPEPLLLSSHRLPALLPRESVVDYRRVRQMPSIGRSALREPGLWFCGTQDLARFDEGSIDVLINVASFQEMTKEQVSAYLALIDTKVEGVFYTQQYWRRHEGIASYDVIAGLEEYEFPGRWRRCYLRKTPFSEKYFEGAFLTRP